jgi:hypothetical protein
VPFYSVLLAATLVEQGRRDEASAVIDAARARYPDYRVAAITRTWVANDERFVRGRDRIVAIAGELGLPP